jgi:hypothetical protein
MNRFSRLVRTLNHRALPAMILLAITIIISPALPIFPHVANAQPSSQLPPFVGRVCIVPGDSKSCPLTLPTMIGPSSGRLNVSINVLGSTIFNTFDVLVRWDPTLMNATTVDFTGMVLLSANATVECINGGGSRCGSLDGPGIAHIVAGGANTTAPASGRLFRIPFFATPGATLSVGFQTGCLTGSVPNTSACVLVGIASTVPTFGITPVPEGIQSQLLGPQLPTPLASVFPAGNITVNISGGSPTQLNETFITPFFVTLPGSISAWKVQFTGGLSGGTNPGPVDPVGIQIVVFRKTSGTALTAVGAGPVHNSRAILQSRIAGYPFYQTNQSVTGFFFDPEIPVLPGDLIGITYSADPLTGFFTIPGVTTTPLAAHTFGGNATIGATISLNSTGPVQSSGFPPFCPCWSPAIQVLIRVPPPLTDTARDGITDFVKLSPDMQVLGTDPCRKTVAVQLDYMALPLPGVIDTVVASFDAAPVPAILPCPYAGFPLKSSGIKLIVDVRNQIPFQSWLNFTQSYPMTFDYVKAAFFDLNRARYFHYGVWAHDLAPNPPQNGISGAGEVFGSNFMITLGEWRNGGSFRQQIGTLMHEIGHNLGLSHGGNGETNHKPNYLSVMNYAFQTVGITTQLPGGGNVTRFDFSRQILPSLNESALDERVVLSNSNDITRWACPDGRHVHFGLVSAPLDWNCSTVIDSQAVSVDINNDTSLETLTGFNDWANLRYNFTTSAAFGPGCRIGCEIGCRIGCEIGCRIGCELGAELTFPQAQVIEAQWKAFFATLHDSTSTGVNCVPASVPVGGTSLCTATVTDINAGATTTPAGTVTFESGQLGSFSPTSLCTLAGTGASASCSLTYTPASTSLNSQTISALYGGESIHLGSIGTTTVTGLLPISVFFTDATPTPLKLDQNGNPKVVVNLGGGQVKSTNPGQIMAWLNITNSGTSPIQSLNMTETLPVDWAVAPMWTPGGGAIHVYFQNTTGLNRNLEITNASIISVSTSNPEQVTIAITNLSLTAIHHSLMQGQTILVSIKLSYSLIGTPQSTSSYPRTYTDSAVAAAWVQPNFTDGKFAGQASSFFIAYAKS